MWKGLLSEVSKGMILSAIPVSIQDNHNRFSVHLTLYNLPCNVDLRNLLKILLTFMTTFTWDAVAHIHSWLKPIPETGITWVNCYRGLLEWGGIGGGKMAKRERIQCERQREQMRVAFFSDGIHCNRLLQTFSGSFLCASVVFRNPLKP